MHRSQLRELLRGADPGEQVIVASQYDDFLRITEAALQEEYISWVELYSPRKPTSWLK